MFIIFHIRIKIIFHRMFIIFHIRIKIIFHITMFIIFHIRIKIIFHIRMFIIFHIRIKSFKMTIVTPVLQTPSFVCVYDSPRSNVSCHTY